MTYDLFISHASEDKAALVETLVAALAARGLRVWYDSHEIRLGDDFRRKMDEGLAGSRFGVVVLSPAFRKHWPEAELSALFNQERVLDEKRILPVAHGMTPREVTEAWPLLAGRAMAYSSEGVDALVEKICAAIEPGTPVGDAAAPGAVADGQPFEPWKPVVPPSFVGRKAALYRLESALGSRNGVSIVGDGKIGKSSLLLTWQQKLQHSGRTVRLIDGQGTAGSSEGAFVTAITGRPAPEGADPAADALAGGVAFGVAGGVAFLRVPLYPVEVLLQSLLYWHQRLTGTLSLDTSPVLWHELSYLPLPFLGRHIEITAERDPELARRALAACEIAPGQRRVGRLALARIQGRELEKVGRKGRFRALVDGDTEWLPADAAADAETATLRQVARYAMAAQAAQTTGQRVEHLKRAKKSLDGLEVTLLEMRANRTGLRRSVLSAWQRTISELMSRAEREATGQVPNPFRAGDPLEPDLGRDVFRGREAVARRIELLLADPTRSASIALLAPRRCGKTSMLKMLPELIPDAVCVFFDLQQHPIDTPAGFFQALDRETRVQARRSRRWQ